MPVVDGEMDVATQMRDSLVELPDAGVAGGEFGRPTVEGAAGEGLVLGR